MIIAQRALERLDGVEKAQVSLREAKAEVAFDPARVGAAQMIAALRSVGFRAGVLSSDPGGAAEKPAGE
ncbi:MAG: heavy-metal-associated domain-containing protein [Candidatus Tectomicrobia bacterium]|nr:heavy-metal-associated domain-containing protein [Candidatus Tectomicrobia bacterium]